MNFEREFLDSLLALAMYGPLVFTDGQLEKEGLGALAVALALAGTVRAAEANRGTASAALAGYLWGMVTLRRGDTGGFFECLCVTPGSASRRLKTALSS